MKIISFLLLGLPFSAFAAAPTYQLLAPLGPLSGSVTMTDYLSGIMQVVIGIAGILAVVMIVICGIQLLGSPSVSQKSASKECITNAILGLLLAAGSWIILNTINSDLLKSDITLGDLPAVAVPPPVAPGDDPMPVAADKTYYYYRFLDGAGKQKNSPKFDTVAACLSVKTTDAANGVIIVKTPAASDIECFTVYAAAVIPPGGETAARNAICGNDSCIGSKPVGINAGPCIGGLLKGCTNVDGLPGGAIAVIQSLASAVRPVTITGGTEGGHKTHRPGSPIFDLRKTSALDAHIRANSTQSAASFWPCRYLLSGYWFTDEGDHWHVCEVGQPYWFCTGNDRSGRPLAAGFAASCPQ